MKLQEEDNKEEKFCEMIKKVKIKNKSEKEELPFNIMAAAQV